MSEATETQNWQALLQEQGADNRPIALVGYGSIGKRYARILREYGHRVFIYDLYQSGAHAAVNDLGVSTCDTLEALLALEPALCIVATPPNQHRAPAEAALARDIPTLIEKPLAHSVEDGAALAAAARASNAPSYCVCNMRFHPGVMMAHAARTKIGDLAFVRAHFGHRLSQMRPVGTAVFAADADAGGGVVLDCIHEFDYLQSLLGPLRFVSSQTGTVGPDPIAAEDWARIELCSEDNTPVSLDLDFISRRKHRGYELVGSEGSLIWTSLGRAPEEVMVEIATATQSEVLFRASGLPADDEYAMMLAQVLASAKDARGLGVTLQSVSDAAHSLTLCLQAIGKETPHA